MRLWFDTKVWLDWWKHWFGQLKQSIFFPRDIPLINDTRDKIERTCWLEHFIYRLPIKNGWYEFNNIEDQSFVFKLIIFLNGDTVSKRISNSKWIFHVKIDRHKVYEFTCSTFSMISILQVTWTLIDIFRRNKYFHGIMYVM